MNPQPFTQQEVLAFALTIFLYFLIVVVICLAEVVNIWIEDRKILKKK